MKSNWFFWLFLSINMITLLVSVMSMATMFTPVQNLDGSLNGSPVSNGMTAFGRLLTWLIPLVLVVWMAIAFWLRSKGKISAANILLGISAAPMLIGIVLWGGLAVIFILFGK